MASKNTSEPISSPSSSPSHGPRNYDVFLSFRGEDTRKNFTDHLYHALKDAGINTYKDDNHLQRGKAIAIELLNAIQESRISLIIFSRNYAASRWCLEELVKIMECRKTVQQVALPVFYDVTPSDVRKQTGCFGEAFAKLVERSMAGMDKVSIWRDALTEAASLVGWDVRSAKDGYEATLVKKIVKEILNHLNNTYLNVAKYPVGIDLRVQYVKKLLHVGLNDVRIIGICATGGMGKTTIAKAIFNQLYDSFTDKSFLANVREISKQFNGQVHLQEQLLSDILKMKKIKVGNINRGIHVIKERLCNRRVLVILDDADQSGQLNALAGKRDWFGSGSRIIVTTRDKHLLKKIEVDDIYMLDELDCCQSLELFSWHAFKKCHPKKDYIDLSNEVINYCKGLPLALEVLGSFLFGRSAPEWKSQLEKLKRIPPGDIQKKLRISYDALEDNEKDIFLDIAYFFIGVDKDYAVRILHGCDFFANIGISVLFERCLLNINEKNELTMHDLLQDMGREIACKESPEKPRKCSRLWFHDDFLNILTELTVQDGGTQLKRRQQYLLEGLAASLQLVDPFSKSGQPVKLAPKDDLLFLRFVSLPKGRKLLSRYLQLIPPAADLARIVYMAIFRHLRSLFGNLPFDSGAFEATTNLANTISSCVNGMDLRGLSFCLVAVVCSSEQPPPLRRLGSPTGDGAAIILISVLEKATELLTDSHAAGKFSMPTCALWQASFDAFFDLLTKYCGNKYDTIVKSFPKTQPSKEIISLEVARAICQEMPVELLSASHPHTNEGQRKLLSDFAQRSMLVTRFNAHGGSSGQKIISESVRPLWTKS